MNIILFETPDYRENLKPIVLTRPISDIRLGIVTIKQKWEKRINAHVSDLTEGYLSIKYPCNYDSDNMYINASFLPDKLFLDEILSLKPESGLIKGNDILAYRTSKHLDFGFQEIENSKEYTNEVAFIIELPHLYLKNGDQIVQDFALETEGKISEPISDKFSSVYNPENVFLGKNVSIKAAILNAEAGPIYIADNAIIQEGAIIVGPASVGEFGMVAFGAKIRMNTSIGPHCRVGGEVSNSIFQEFANKAHDGFLGNSYIGSWCNLGANTNNSNLKNNYKEVKLYSYKHKDFYNSLETFCGTFMGDFSKTSISTMLNTGTVIGVSSNLFGAGFHSKFVPSFSWGGTDLGYTEYNFEKAIEAINATMSRKELQLSKTEEKILKVIGG